jgi:two-component system NtrC family sensor kinase
MAARNLGRRGLAARLTLAVTGIALFTVGVLAFLGLREQEEHVEEVVARTVALLSDSVKNSTHEHMLADRRHEAYATMRAIGRGEGVEKVRIFNKEGTVTFSTEKGETATVVDKRAESCYACHEADRPLERLTIGRRTRVYRAPDGHRVLGMVTPIYNEPSCAGASCHAHPEAQRVLGVADVGVSLREIDRGFARLHGRSVLAASGGLLLLASGVALFAQRLVVGPVTELVRGTERIARGDLDHRIPGGGSDEIGQLAASFNVMTGALQVAKQEIAGLMGGLERQVEQRTAALKEAQAQLVQAAKLASLGRLAASIAHEINNPLTGILTFARLMLRRLEAGELDAPGRDACLRELRLMERETQRCTRIVSDLLDFARQRPLALQRMSVERAVDEALSLLQHQLELKGLVLDKRLGQTPEIDADFGQLRQAFVNLFLNACDAMGTGGRLTVETRALPQGVVIVVEDTGVGIEPEHLERIFDPFFTTKQKGTGLGLSVVHGIVERHGGRLAVRSELGRGTRFEITLPAAGSPGPDGPDA